MSQLGICPVSSGGKQRQSPCTLPKQVGSMCFLEEVQERFTRVPVTLLVKIADKHVKKLQILAGFIYGIFSLCSLLGVCPQNHGWGNLLTKSSSTTASASESILLQKSKLGSPTAPPSSTQPQEIRLCFHTLSLVADNDEGRSQLCRKSPEGMSLLHWQIRNVSSDLKRKSPSWLGVEPWSWLSKFIQKGIEVLLFLERGAQGKCNYILRRLKNKLYWKTLENQEFWKKLQAFCKNKAFHSSSTWKTQPLQL